MTVLRVGHVGLRVPDLDRSVAHAVEVIGLRVSRRDDGAAYLTCNARHHELVLLAGDHAACDHLAFEALGREAYRTLVERIEGSGLEVVDRGALEPGIEDAIRFIAPGGFVIEVFTGMANDQPATYPTPAPRPAKFEHITVKSTQKAALEGTLIDVLGLRLSDRAEEAISWLRAGAEHHGVSVIGADVDALHHYAWQFGDFGALGRVGDHLMHHGHTFLWGPGHHGIGDNYFAYALDADGVIVEYSSAIQRIEDESCYAPRVWPDEPLSVNRWGNPEPPRAFQEAATPLVQRSAVAS
jgi:catechol 2,3-dioxygenase